MPRLIVLMFTLTLAFTLTLPALAQSTSSTEDYWKEQKQTICPLVTTPLSLANTLAMQDELYRKLYAHLEKMEQDLQPLRAEAEYLLAEHDLTPAGVQAVNGVIQVHDELQAEMTRLASVMEEISTEYHDLDRSSMDTSQSEQMQTRCNELFDRYISDNNTALEVAITQTEALEPLLQSYLETRANTLQGPP